MITTLVYVGPFCRSINLKNLFLCCIPSPTLDTIPTIPTWTCLQSFKTTFEFGELDHDQSRPGPEWPEPEENQLSRRREPPEAQKTVPGRMDGRMDGAVGTRS